jgi:hypothetical protein
MDTVEELTQVGFTESTPEVVGDVTCGASHSGCGGYCVRGTGHPGDHVCNMCKQPF